MPCDILRKKLKDTRATKIFKMVALRAYGIFVFPMDKARYRWDSYFPHG